jgi:GNAT superfamily N-acetyltransferase
VVIEPLADNHDRSSFDCGVVRLNDFLRKTAKQHAAKDVGVTHVVVENAGSPQIIGFETLTIKSVTRELLPNASKLPRGDYSVAFVGQLAVDSRFQGRGIGTRLLYFALFKALEVSDVFGLIGVALDVLSEEGESPDEHAKRLQFYLDRGFQPLSDGSSRLYLPISTVRKMGLR